MRNSHDGNKGGGAARGSYTKSDAGTTTKQQRRQDGSHDEELWDLTCPGVSSDTSRNLIHNDGFSLVLRQGLPGRYGVHSRRWRGSQSGYIAGGRVPLS